eukprot:5625675-Pyramimonas_sp.AAC.1
MLDILWGPVNREVLTRSPASVTTTSETAADLIHGIAVDLGGRTGGDGPDHSLDLDPRQSFPWQSYALGR